ncbi:FtsK/SpoIIIE domain-containing protein [Actinoallomurus sp. NPDC052308]|uniref:FtsK/SpoIIIE domain-containing protein n=1 Tax=Actinoallomurus sp. NPDC052308 TaxID=3155530 RepID=UPI00342442BB
MSTRQLRRQARKMSRHGIQPMMVINSDSQVPDMIGVLIARWVWRYRSELAPLNLACLTSLAAWLLHTTHPGWWPELVGVAVVTAAMLLRFGHRAGLVRRSERLYAALVAVFAGGWLATATSAGPTSRPLPQSLLVGGVLLSVPWWAHRRRRARVRVERTLTAWPEIAESVGLNGSRVMSAVVDAWGWTARMALRRGHTVADVIGKLSAIESALGTRPGAVRIEPDAARADHFLMRVLHTDPHARPVPWRAPDIHSIAQPIPLGVFEDASPATVLLLRRHALIGGVVGSGKSGVLNVILAALTACEDVVIWGIDLKGGMELRPWVRALDRLATTPEQATRLFRDAVAELDRRATESGHHGARVWEPTRRRPALVIVVDEYAELPEAATAYADSIARRGRAVAVTLLAATQRPTQKAMGHGATRSQMDVRICLRVRERRDVDLILGQGAFNAGWHAHTLDAPGKFLISAPEHPTAKRARAYLITDQGVTATADRYAVHRPVLNPPHPAPDPNPDQTPDKPNGTAPAEPTPEQPATSKGRLWEALHDAPEGGISVARLIKITGMSRPTLYRRLAEHVDAGRVVQVRRGRYRAASPESDDGG